MLVSLLALFGFITLLPDCWLPAAGATPILRPIIRIIIIVLETVLEVETDFSHVLVFLVVAFQFALRVLPLLATRAHNPNFVVLDRVVVHLVAEQASHAIGPQFVALFAEFRFLLVLQGYWLQF